ncbi:MAG: tRNA 2-thiocytidine(32) synthetase TtcA [Erysipelotrichaceae bacterium]|nr:tRNA 2-thiocytidine(32) synthetase TtcA [Erysipelotrichaceae bacterium]
MKLLLRKISHADYDYEMIDDGDIIGVGISGGKDSTLLLYALNKYRIKSGKQFKVIGIHIQLGFDGDSFEPVQTYFDGLGIEMFQAPSNVAKILELNKTPDGRIRCSLCSKFKKAAVIAEAKKHGCNKIAFAHHADDAVETMMLNAIYGGKLNTFDPKMFLTEAKITFLRPFIYVRESEIIAQSKQIGIPVIKSGCPMDGVTKRQDMKELLAEIYERFPQSRDNFLKMLHNPDQISLWDPKKR